LWCEVVVDRRVGDEPEVPAGAAGDRPANEVPTTVSSSPAQASTRVAAGMRSSSCSGIRAGASPRARPAYSEKTTRGRSMPTSGATAARSALSAPPAEWPTAASARSPGVLASADRIPMTALGSASGGGSTTLSW
jgi:hypothetical protein